MTTLRKMSHQAMRLLSNGPVSRDSQLSHKYLQEEIRQVAQKLLRTEYFNAMSAGEREMPGVCVATYELQVETDARGRCYIDLPAQPMNIPGGTGVQQVKPISDDPASERAMIPIMQNESELFRSLLVGTEIMKDQWCFEVDRDKIYFTDNNGDTLEDSGIENVELKMCVIDPSQVEEDDMLPVPPEMEIDILKEVLVLHGYQPSVARDLINNGNPAK